MPTVLLASCAGAGDPDEPLLLAALAAVGVDAASADWADPAVDWAAASAVVVRSTWDYPLRRAEFLGWAEAVARRTQLINPLEMLVWNTDKRYLQQLAEAGAPVVPTAWAASVADVGPALDRWAGDVVVKPVVSAGARDTGRFRPDERDAALELAGRVLASGRPVMVQPYLTRLDAEGETGLVYLDGAYSHAFGKAALLAGDPLGPGLFAEEVITPREAAEDQRAVGDALVAMVVERIGDVPLYARIDVVPGDDGEAQVIEVELTEPSLNLAVGPGSARRLATAIAARLD